METPLRVLMLTSHWPTPGVPRTTHFIKRQADFLRTAGIALDVFHFRAARRPWNYAAAWMQCRSRIRSGRYDLIHAQFGYNGLLALPKRLPLVVTLRGSDILGIVGDDGRYTTFGNFGRQLTRYVARHADAVVAVSDHMRQLIPPHVPVTVLPSGIDFELFRRMSREETRRQLGLPLDGKLVLFAGNPQQARKRFGLASQVHGLLDPALNARMVIAWGVPHTDMPLYMNACDALLFTSMQEGSPNVVKEALACDLPVVSVVVGDVAQRLAGVAGCELCPDERPESIAVALERVLRRGQRVAGRASVMELDEHRITSALIRLYTSVLARARSTARPPVQSGLPWRAAAATGPTGVPARE